MAGAREWIGLIVLCLPVFLVMMDFSVLYLAMPDLAASLAPSGSEQLWIVDVYGFLIAGFLVTMGTLGDRIGRKNLLLAGGAVFGLASIAAAFATSPEMLIAVRAVLGVAGAAVMPSVLALVTTLFTDEKERGRAFGVYLACLMGGATLGPLVGGALLEFFWWGSVFLISVPGFALLLLLGPSLLPTQERTTTGRLDPLSVVMSLVAVLAFVFGIKELARYGWTWFPALSLVVGVAVGVLFVRRQRALAEPLLDLRIFGNRTFSAALTLMLVCSVVGTGTLLLVTLYLQNVAGMAPLAAGLLLLAPNVLMIVGLMGSPKLTAYVRTAYLIAGGLFVAGAGYLLYLASDTTSGPAWIVIAMCIVMLGTGPLAAFCNHLAMGAVPADKVGSGAAIVQTTNEFGLGLGIATLATLGSIVYRGTIEGSLGGLDPATADAARESIDRAVAVSAELPAGPGGELLTAAREAFTSGLHVVGVVCAVAYFALGIVAVRAFKDAPGPDGAAAADEETTTESAREGAGVA